MSVDAYRAMRAMLALYSMLHPSLRASRDVSWEMDFDTVAALFKALPISGRDFVTWYGEHRDEMQCLGLRVSVVERPGVRLVIEMAGL